MLLCLMMMSSNGNTFRVTGRLWWNPLRKASDAELWIVPVGVIRYWKMWVNVPQQSDTSDDITTTTTTTEHYKAGCKWFVFLYSIMASSNGNFFCVTGPLWGNPPVTGGFPSQRPVTRSFDVFFYLRLNKRFSNNRTHYDVTVML